LTINDSLSLIERSVLCNIQLYENFEDKVIYFEKYYNNLIKQVFNKKNYIVETYRRKFTRNLIIESTFDFQNEIKKTHNFIKKAIKFDTLLEQEMNVGRTMVTQARDTVGPQVASQTLYYNAKTKKYETATTKVQKMGWDSFFDTFRNILSSKQYAGLETLLGIVTGGSTKAVTASGWGSIILYDAAKIFLEKQINRVPQLIYDIISFFVELLPIKGLDKLTNAKNVILKISGDTIEEILKNIIEKLSSLGNATVFYTLVSSFNKVLGHLKNAAIWIEKQFDNKYTFFTSAIKSVQDFMNKVKGMLEKMVTNDLNDVKEFGKKAYDTYDTISKQKQNNTASANYKMDPGKI